MNQQRLTPLSILGLAFACFTLAAAAPAGAAISRGCNAQYELVYLLVDDGKLITPQSLAFGRFTSRGQCRSRVYANDCRREARSLAQSCMDAHVRERWEREKPGECYRQRANMGPQDYSLEDLKHAIELTVCCDPKARSFRREAVVRVVGRTWGDTRCDSTEVLLESYKVTTEMCAAVDSKLCGGE